MQYTVNTKLSSLRQCYRIFFVSSTLSILQLVHVLTDGSTSSATALRGKYGSAAIHQVNDFYDSLPFVSRPAVDQSSHMLTDITSHANNTQSSDAAVSGHKGFYALYFVGNMYIFVNCFADFCLASYCCIIKIFIAVIDK